MINKHTITFNDKVTATFYGAMHTPLNMARYRYLMARYKFLPECNKDKGLWGKMNRAAAMRMLNTCRTHLHNAIAMEISK